MQSEILFESQKKYFLTALFMQKMLEERNSSVKALNLAVFSTKSGGFVVFLSSINCDLYHYAGNNPVKYVDPDGKCLNFVIGAGIGFVSATAAEVGSRMIQGQDFSDAFVNSFHDPFSRNSIIASTVIGAATSGASGLAVKAVTSTAKTISSVALRTVATNAISGAIDSGLKDVATKAIKGEKQSVSDTVLTMAKGAGSAALFSGATESVIANGTKSSSTIVNVMTKTFKDSKLYQPEWAGSVGVIGENVLPMAVDLGKEVYKLSTNEDME